LYTLSTGRRGYFDNFFPKIDRFLVLVVNMVPSKQLESAVTIRYCVSNSARISRRFIRILPSALSPPRCILLFYARARVGRSINNGDQRTRRTRAAFTKCKIRSPIELFRRNKRTMYIAILGVVRRICARKSVFPFDTTKRFDSTPPLHHRGGNFRFDKVASFYAAPVLLVYTIGRITYRDRKNVREYSGRRYN